MSPEGESTQKSGLEHFNEMVRAFGDALSEIFNDPRLKDKARELGDTAVESAKTFGSRFKDEEVKEKFRAAGKAAEDFGKSVADYFKAGKSK